MVPGHPFLVLGSRLGFDMASMTFKRKPTNREEVHRLFTKIVAGAESTQQYGGVVWSVSRAKVSCGGLTVRHTKTSNGKTFTYERCAKNTANEVLNALQGKIGNMVLIGKERF